MRIRSLSILAVLVTAFLGSSAQAAKYRLVNKPTDPKLAASMKVWRSVTRNLCDAGCQSVCITSKKPSEPWTNTIQQVLWKQYTEGVDATKIKATKSSIAVAVDVIFQKNSELNSCSSARAKMINAIYDAARGKGMSVYAGDIWGAFSTNYAHVTILDKKRNQLFSIFAGYSE